MQARSVRGNYSWNRVSGCLVSRSTVAAASHRNAATIVLSSGLFSFSPEKEPVPSIRLPISISPIPSPPIPFHPLSCVFPIFYFPSFVSRSNVALVIFRGNSPPIPPASNVRRIFISIINRTSRRSVVRSIPFRLSRLVKCQSLFEREQNRLLVSLSDSLSDSLSLPFIPIPDRNCWTDFAVASQRAFPRIV